MVKVSAVQMAINDKSLDANVQKIRESISLANGSDIICFPETSLTGLMRPQAREVGGLLRIIGNELKSAGMWAVFGGYAQRGEKTFNEVYVLNRIGKLVHTYKKRRLWNEEGITPGRVNRAIDTDFGRIGVITCWDIAFPGDVRRLAKQGAQIILAPAYWFDKPGPNKLDYFGYPEARAHENQVYFVFCDAHSEEETLGRSKILSPVKVLAEARGEEMISADLDLKKLDGWREIYDCWK